MVVVLTEMGDVEKEQILFWGEEEMALSPQTG